MPKVSKSALVHYSASEMYDLVNDVAKYPEFIPHCRDAKIVKQSDGEMVAGLEIAKVGLKKWFTTRNTLTPHEKVTLTLEDGPFKSLFGAWQFKALDDKACKVTLELEFEFTNKMVEMAFGKVFNEVAQSMVKAFTERAKAVYGVRI